MFVFKSGIYWHWEKKQENPTLSWFPIFSGPTSLVKKKKKKSNFPSCTGICIGVLQAKVIKTNKSQFFLTVPAQYFLWGAFRKDFSWQSLVQPLFATANGYSPSWCCITSLPLWWSCFPSCLSGASSVRCFTCLLESVEQQYVWTGRISPLHMSTGFSPVTKKRNENSFVLFQ